MQILFQSLLYLMCVEQGFRFKTGFYRFQPDLSKYRQTHAIPPASSPIGLQVRIIIIFLFV